MRLLLVCALTLSFSLPSLDSACFAQQESSKSALIVQHNVPFGTSDNKDDEKFLQLDIYRKAEQKQAPILIMVHGGAWRTGDKANKGVTSPKAEYFVNLGYVFVSINYRLSPAVQHPTHVEDVALAIAWVHKYASHIGGDPKRLCLIGHSAGAHLVALVTTNASYLKAHKLSPSDIKAVVSLDSAALDVDTELRGTSIRAIRRKMLEQAFGTDPQKWKSASPIQCIEKGTSYPDFLLFWTKNRKDAERAAKTMQQKLREVGSKAEVIHAPDRSHKDMNQKIGETDDPYSKQIQEFLASALKLETKSQEKAASAPAATPASKPAKN